MSYNGSGTFLINTAGQPVVSGTVISSTAFNALTADLATGLSTAITKDGQTTVTANIPMSTYKFTGLGTGSAATDSANLSQVQSTVSKLLNTITGTNTITATASPTLSAYAAGQMFYFVAAGDNTTSVTLNIDGLGAKAVTRDGSTALISGDIKSGEVVVVVYDGTRFQVVSQVNSAGDATFANVSITSALNVGGVATFTSNPVLSGGTANGVLYLNGSKVATSGSALTYNGTTVSLINNASASSVLLSRTSAVARDWSLGIDGDGGFRLTDSTGSLITLSALPSGITYLASQTELAFRYNSTTEGMRLTSTGLGIGTSSPSDIATLAGGASGSYGLTINNAKAGGGTKAIFQYDATNQIALVGGNTTNGLAFQTLTSGSLTTKAVIDASGNLGLGSTPAAWAARALQVSNLTGFAQDANGYAVMSNNAYNDTGSAYRYLISSYAAARYQQDSGLHKWFTAPSGTAGNAISFTQAMTLDASGNLGIGTTNPIYKLVVSNAGAQGFEFDPSTGILQVYNRSTSAYGELRPYGSLMRFYTGSSPVETMRLDSSGNLLVGTTSTSPSSNVGVKIYPDGRVYGVSASSANTSESYGMYSTSAAAYRFYVGWGGTVYATNTTISAISDRRLKENIRDLDSGLDAIMALKPRKFDWKEGKGKDIKNDRGFIAQEFEQVFPDLIDTWKDPAPEGEEPYKSVRQDLIPVLVKAMQEQQAMIETLKAEVAALKGA